MSAQCENFIVKTNGFDMPVSGTSAASPTFAGIIALLNHVRQSSSGKNLGFLNPLL